MKAPPLRFPTLTRLALPVTARPGSRAAVLLLLAGVSSVLTFGFSVVAARFLEPTAYGGFMALFGLWSLLTMPTVTVQLVAARHLAGPDSGAAGFRRQLVGWLGGGLVAISPLLAVGVWLTAHRLGLGQAVTTVIALQALWLGTWTSWLRGRAQAQESFLRFGLSDVTAAALRFAVLPLLLVAGLAPDWSLFVSLGVGSLAMVAALPLASLTKDAAPLESKTLLASSGSSLLVALALGALTNLDLLWSHYALAGSQAGFFAAGTLASRPFILLGAVAGTLLLPRVANHSTSRAELRKTTLLLLVGALVLAAAAQLLAAPLVTLLFGETYRVAATVARLAAWGGALFAPLVLVANTSVGLGRHRAAAGFAGFTATVVLATFSFAHSGAAYWGVCGVAAAGYLLLELLRLSKV